MHESCLEGFMEEYHAFGFHTDALLVKKSQHVEMVASSSEVNRCCAVLIGNQHVGAIVM